MLEMLSSFIHTFLASFQETCIYMDQNNFRNTVNFTPDTVLAFNSSNVWRFAILSMVTLEK